MAATRTPVADCVLPVLEEGLFGRSAPADAFNPWHDHDPELEREGGPVTRRANFRRYLEAFPDIPPVVLVGEAPSWRGCRFTGIPFTAEANLLDPDFPLDGERTSAFRERPLAEASATIVWGGLREHFPRFLLWNALPFHPHPPGKRLGNRTPRRSEVSDVAGLLRDVLDALGADEVLAVGRVAERVLEDLEIGSRYIRHPSHGGAKEFTAGVLEVLE